MCESCTDAHPPIGANLPNKFLVDTFFSETSVVCTCAPLWVGLGRVLARLLISSEPSLDNTRTCNKFIVALIIVTMTYLNSLLSSLTH